jgi:F-type H+-transporting ATPase subunit delta
MLDPVTIRYAQALFNVACQARALDAVQRDVERLGRELQGELGSRVFDARLSLDGRRKELEARLSGAHELVQNFVGLLFDKRREEVLRHVAEAFRLRVLADQNLAEGVVESARPLGEKEIGDLARLVGQRLGKTVRLENRVSPSLLGGVRVTVENRMIDGSVRGRLDGLSKRLHDAPLPAPSSN